MRRKGLSVCANHINLLYEEEGVVIFLLCKNRVALDFRPTLRRDVQQEGFRGDGIPIFFSQYTKFLIFVDFIGTVQPIILELFVKL